MPWIAGSSDLMRDLLFAGRLQQYRASAARLGRADRAAMTLLPNNLLAQAAALLVLSLPAVAQQPVQPLPKVGGCPLGYYSSGSYCVPSKGDRTPGALQKSGSCPLGFYASGNYCVSSPNSTREAIQKSGKSCPLGWYSSGSYCVKSP
jgi:hypothetical protein